MAQAPDVVEPPLVRKRSRSTSFDSAGLLTGVSVHLRGANEPGRDCEFRKIDEGKTARAWLEEIVEIGNASHIQIVDLGAMSNRIPVEENALMSELKVFERPENSVRIEVSSDNEQLKFASSKRQKLHEALRDIGERDGWYDQVDALARAAARDEALAEWPDSIEAQIDFFTQVDLRSQTPPAHIALSVPPAQHAPASPKLYLTISRAHAGRNFSAVQIT